MAAPGCFPTASLLPLLPFLKQGLIETGGIIVDAKTGTSGGGRVPKQSMLLAEASEAIAPYGVVGHRHTSEIEQMAEEVAGQTVQLQFTPHLVPMVRGLLSTIYARLRDPGLTAEDCTTVLQAVYRHHPCIEVLPVGIYPATKWVRHTNKAMLSVQVDTRTGQLVLMSVIDNLVKGQAGQGVQCTSWRLNPEQTFRFRRSIPDASADRAASAPLAADDVPVGECVRQAMHGRRLEEQERRPGPRSARRRGLS